MMNKTHIRERITEREIAGRVMGKIPLILNPVIKAEMDALVGYDILAQKDQQLKMAAHRNMTIKEYLRVNGEKHPIPRRSARKKAVCMLCLHKRMLQPVMIHFTTDPTEKKYPIWICKKDLAKANKTGSVQVQDGLARAIQGFHDPQDTKEKTTK